MKKTVTKLLCMYTKAFVVCFFTFYYHLSAQVFISKETTVYNNSHIYIENNQAKFKDSLQTFYKSSTVEIYKSAGAYVYTATTSPSQDTVQSNPVLSYKALLEYSKQSKSNRKINKFSKEKKNYSLPSHCIKLFLPIESENDKKLVQGLERSIAVTVRQYHDNDYEINTDNHLVRFFYEFTSITSKHECHYAYHAFYKAYTRPPPVV